MGGFPILNLQLVKKWAPEFLKNWFSILEVPVVKWPKIFLIFWLLPIFWAYEGTVKLSITKYLTKKKEKPNLFWLIPGPEN